MPLDIEPRLLGEGHVVGRSGEEQIHRGRGIAVVAPADLPGEDGKERSDHLEPTEFGRSLITALTPLGEWGEENMERLEALP
ncbi:hypothetical protein [Streptomyces cyaneofuscatus]|uniref:hypothetical protein n=1 Tax=Streptomyces cyaneofuscatus TaxID=66883 RepID=UPI0037B5C8E3